MALSSGDFIFLPRGMPHALVHEPNAKAIPMHKMFGERPKGETRIVKIGGDGPTVSMIWGHFEFDTLQPQPLWSLLPDIVHGSLFQGDKLEWYRLLTDLTHSETPASDPWHSALSNRVAEALLIQFLEVHDLQQAQGRSFLKTFADPFIGQALQLIHHQYCQSWTVEALSQEVGLSRSVFAKRFREMLGIPPMQYVNHCRMQKAGELLLSTDWSIATIGYQVGYKSEWAFAKVFKKTFGLAPGTFRKFQKKHVREP